jgi:hypothetical protein
MKAIVDKKDIDQTGFAWSSAGLCQAAHTAQAVNQTAFPNIAAPRYRDLRQPPAWKFTISGQAGDKNS